MAAVPRGEEMSDYVHDHTHEWQVWNAGAGTWATCKHAQKGCEAYLNANEIGNRLDATEHISANDARWLLKMEAANENDDIWILHYYAEAMEGK
jgi:hypothetical protein